MVNLIPYIVPKHLKDKRKCPSPPHIKKFQSIVASYGALCNVKLNMSVQLSKQIAEQSKALQKSKSKDPDVLQTSSSVRTKRAMKTPLIKKRLSGVPEEDDDTIQVADNEIFATRRSTYHRTSQRLGVPPTVITSAAIVCRIALFHRAR